PEDIEDPRCSGNARDLQHLVDPGSELMLVVVPLKGPAACQDAIAEWRPSLELLKTEPSGDDEDVACELPGISKGDSAFGRILDDIDNVSEIHHVGLKPWRLGVMSGVPPGASDPLSLEQSEVITAPASIVEEEGVGCDQSIGECQTYRSGQLVTCD